jgi:hypothetical protein
MHIKTSNKLLAIAPPARQGRGARVAGLTTREAEVLRLLDANRNKLNTPYIRGEAEPGWCRPRDLGGTQKSHHSNTLCRLSRLRYVDKKSYLGASTYSSIYRISDAGIAAWSLYTEHLRRQRHLSPAPVAPVSPLVTT